MPRCPRSGHGAGSRRCKFSIANSPDQGGAAGKTNPEARKFRSMLVITVGKTPVKCLVDTGAGPSCISEELLQCNPFFKGLTIRKCDKKAYSVSGAPVVTLGVVTLEFKLAKKFSYTHEFTILRGLIHPILLGMDFLTKYNAVIQFDHMPNISLRHPVHKYINVGFAKPPKMDKGPNHIALVTDIEIPPLSIYYADAYHTNFEEIGKIKPMKDRLLGIAAVQKVEDTFDPGVIMRDAVISANETKFKIEIMNPSNFSLKLSAETPLGAIFDYDCEIIETGQQQDKLWDEPPKDESETFMRQQALLIASINVTEEDPLISEEPEITKDPQCWPQNRPPSATAANTTANESREENACDEIAPLLPTTPFSAMSPSRTSPNNEEVGEKVRERDPTIEKDRGCWPQSRPPSCGFTRAYTDEQSELKFVHECEEGKTISKEEKAFMIDLTKVEGTEDQKAKLEEVIRQHEGAFARNERDLGCTDLVYHYAKTTKDQPIRMSYYKAQGTEIKKVIENQTESMLATGVIKESQSPYCSPIVMAKKKDGGWRYCVDLRKINEITEKVTFPVPKIEDALRRLKSPTVFSSLDLLKAYYQIPVAEEDQKYYAFSDGKKHLQFARCPMGAKNSGTTLALLMELVLRGLPPECVLGYLDDILIATEDFDTHIEILDRLLTTLEKANLKLCPGKCDFVRKEVKTLGYTLSADGIRPDDYNLDKIRQWKKADDKKGVRTFLGLTGYYRTHVKKYAHKASPLTDLTKDDTPWKWEAKEQEAFDALKDYLLNEPIAAYPDYDKEFILKADASKVAMGAVLTQKGDDGKERMIACTSKKFGENELKWIPYDREYWAMVYAIRHFSHYLRFKKFTMIIDHKPLLAWRNISTERDATNRRVRWAMELSTYDMDVIFKEGKRHADADALSRHPDPDEPEEEDEDDFISSLNQGAETVIYLIAADMPTELNLVAINLDEALIQEMRENQANDGDISEAIKLITAQNKDPLAWNNIHRWYAHNRDKLAVKQGILFHSQKLKGIGEPIARTVIPVTKRMEMLFRCHGHLQSGHPGAPRAQARLERFASWPGMATDMKNYVRRCVECQATRNPVPKKVAPIEAQEATRPLEYVQADLYYVGKAYNKKDHVLVMEDRATKHCKLYAIGDTKSRSVVRCLEDYVSQMGCPERWGTDGGPEFYDHLVNAMCKALNIKKEYALAYRPQSQGQTERKNRTIKAELRKRFHQFGPNWPSMLKWIEFSYNTAPHPSHKYSPFMLMFGREARMPIDQDIPNLNTKGWETSMKTYFHDFLNRIADIREDAAIRKQAYLAKMRTSHDKNVLPPLEAGTNVLRTIPEKQVGKTDMPKDGPWQVTEQREKEGKKLPVYKIEDHKGNTLLTHRESLTEFYQPMLDETQPTTTATEQPKTAKAKTAESEKPNDGPATRTRSKLRAILSMLEQDEPEKRVTSRNGSESEKSSQEEDGSDDDGYGHNGDDGIENAGGHSETESEPDESEPETEPERDSEEDTEQDEPPSDDGEVFHDTQDEEDDYSGPNSAAAGSDASSGPGERGPRAPATPPSEPGEEIVIDNLLLQPPTANADESEISGAQSGYRTAESSLRETTPKSALKELFGQVPVPHSIIAAEHASGSTFGDASTTSMTSFTSGSTFGEASITTTPGRDEVFSPTMIALSPPGDSENSMLDQGGRRAPRNSTATSTEDNRESLTGTTATRNETRPEEGTVRRTLRNARPTDRYKPHE